MPDLEPLTDAEVRQLFLLLARYATHELDQFEHWSLETRYGDVYMTLARKLTDGSRPANYDKVWPLPPKLRPDSARGVE